MNYLYILCISCLLLGCGQQSPRGTGTESKQEARLAPAVPEPAKPQLAAPVALNAYRETLDLSGYKDLGNFHFRRLHFYAKEKPGITIGPAEVEHVTLYFIQQPWCVSPRNISNPAEMAREDTIHGRGICRRFWPIRWPHRRANRLKQKRTGLPTTRSAGAISASSLPTKTAARRTTWPMS